MFLLVSRDDHGGRVAVAELLFSKDKAEHRSFLTRTILHWCVPEVCAFRMTPSPPSPPPHKSLLKS